MFESQAHIDGSIKPNGSNLCTSFFEWLGDKCSIKGDSFSTSKSSEGLKPVTCTCIVINFISVGYLILPWAFAQAGSLLSSIGFLIVIAQSYIAAVYVLEACARAQALMDEMNKSENTSGNTIISVKSSTKENVDISIVAEENQVQPEILHKIGEQKYELSDLNRVFLGKMPQCIFLATTAFDLYGISWTFATVFASGFATSSSIKGNNVDDYHIYVLIFAVVVVPLSCSNIKDQVLLQISFLVARLVMVLLMIITTLLPWFSGKDHFQDDLGHALSNKPPLFNFSSLYIMLQISVFSTAYQFAVPGISSISQTKTNLYSIFLKASSFIFVSSLVVALLLVNFFGANHMMQSSNLHWSRYHGGTLHIDENGNEEIAVWAIVISYYVVFFPALDAIAVFPLLAISLGESIKSAWYGGRAQGIKDNLSNRLIFRLLGSCPQLVGAYFVSNLGMIANYAGIFTIASYTICPALLAIYSRKVLAKNGMSSETYYRNMFSSDVFAWVIVGAATALIVLVIVSSALGELG